MGLEHSLRASKDSGKSSLGCKNKEMGEEGFDMSSLGAICMVVGYLELVKVVREREANNAH